MAPPAVLSVCFISLLSSLAFSLRAATITSDLLNYKMIKLASVTGPESLVFDATGGGPYTGVSDGRVLKWLGPSRGWTEFSTPSQDRNERECNGSSNTTMEDRCGRPLGLQFHSATGDLYVADAYFGLLVVGPGGGPAVQAATAAGGEPLGLTNGVDIDQESGAVYFTDSSTQFRRRDWFWSVATHDATGRFMKYDPRTKQVTVLLRGLQFPNGVALSRDGGFAVVAESTRKRILRYWLKGPRAGSSEVFTDLISGYPDNIRRNPGGEFWVGVNSGWGRLTSPKRKPTSRTQNVIAIRLNEGGRTLEVLDDRSTADAVSEVAEDSNGTLWIGSADRPFVGIYTP